MGIGHKCLPCLPSGKTLLFQSDLFAIRKVMSWERWEDSELGRWERWEGSGLVRWKRWEDSDMERWER